LTQTENSRCRDTAEEGDGADRQRYGRDAKQGRTRRQPDVAEMTPIL
jgi:hypothetical protein